MALALRTLSSAYASSDSRVLESSSKDSLLREALVVVRVLRLAAARVAALLIRRYN